MNLNQKLPPADRNRVVIKTGRFNKIAAIEGPGELLAAELKAFLAPYFGGTLLIVGIGNDALLHDSLGPMTTRRIPVSGLSKLKEYSPFRSVGMISPGIAAQNNIPNIDVIRGVARQIGASCVLLIDSMITNDFNRMLTMVQISSAGICSLETYTKESIGLPVVGIAVPTVMRMEDELILKACIETDMAAASKMIAYAILRVVYPELEPEECIQLTNPFL